MIDLGSRWIDRSYETFGKYQYCSMVRGIWYADQDIIEGVFFDRVKFGAQPRPGQRPLPWWRKFLG